MNIIDNKIRENNLVYAIQIFLIDGLVQLFIPMTKFHNKSKYYQNILNLMYCNKNFEKIIKKRTTFESFVKIISEYDFIQAIWKNTRKNRFIIIISKSKPCQT